MAGYPKREQLVEGENQKGLVGKRDDKAALLKNDGTNAAYVGHKALLHAVDQLPILRRERGRIVFRRRTLRRFFACAVHKNPLYLLCEPRRKPLEDHHLSEKKADESPILGSIVDMWFVAMCLAPGQNNMPKLWIVEVELVEGDLVGVRLSDDSVFFSLLKRYFHSTCQNTSSRPVTIPSCKCSISRTEALSKSRLAYSVLDRLNRALIDAAKQCLADAPVKPS